jgi:hypothetical protein
MAHSHRLIDSSQIDDHPAAAFGLMIGTLAVLVSVLVFSIYARVDEAGRRMAASPATSVTHTR